MLNAKQVARSRLFAAPGSGYAHATAPFAHATSVAGTGPNAEQSALKANPEGDPVQPSPPLAQLWSRLRQRKFWASLPSNRHYSLGNLVAHLVIVASVVAIFVPFYAALYRDLSDLGPSMLPQNQFLLEPTEPRPLPPRPRPAWQNSTDPAPAGAGATKKYSRAAVMREMNRKRHEKRSARPRNPLIPHLPQRHCTDPCLRGGWGSLLLRLYHSIAAGVVPRVDSDSNTRPYGIEQASCASVSLNALLMPILGIFSFLAVAVGIHGALGSIALLFGNAALGSVCSFGFTPTLGLLLLCAYSLGAVHMLLLCALQTESIARRGRAIVCFSLFLTALTPCGAPDMQVCADSVALASIFFFVMTWEASAVLTLNRKRPVLSLRSKVVKV